MKKLLCALLLSITLVQLCWAAVGPYWEHPATQAHAGHHELATGAAVATSVVAVQTQGDDSTRAAPGFCSSCEMAAASLGYPVRIWHRFARSFSAAPTAMALSFSSHIPAPPEGPDWRVAS